MTLTRVPVRCAVATISATSAVDRGLRSSVGMHASFLAQFRTTRVATSPTVARVLDEHVDARSLGRVTDAADPAQGSIVIREAVKRFDGPDVLCSVSLDIAPHETVALLGPSGCGKTTLLRSIAGLERLDDGEIEIDGVVVSGPGVHVRPEDRRIGMVFQDWALFPHLSVGDNVSYGLTRDERRSGRVDEALHLVGLDGLGDRSPSTLSGGQQQRVALARALAPRPRAILLDEPFSNLDTVLRVQVRTEVHHLLAELGITTVFVTHDQEEAFVLGDRVAVMHSGVIEQHASPAEIYEEPATRWIADFVGEANLLRGDGRGNHVHTAIGTIPVRELLTGPVEVVLRPEELVLGPGDTATVELVEYYGHDHVTLVTLADGQQLRCRAPGAPRHRRGQLVSVRSTGAASVGFSAASSEPA
jgi:iron(III) transport system ATP-binding protein